MTYTNSSLATARACLRKYHLRYNLRLDAITDEREPLSVGNTWHAAHDAVARAGPSPTSCGLACEAIAWHAPSLLWAEKLSRLFVAQEWYWRNQPFDVVESERQFEVQHCGEPFAGKVDARIRLPDRRVGILERKTTSENLEAESIYWNRLRLDVQVGLYALAMPELPAFILYDVVRKPTINPKKLSQKDLQQIRIGHTYYQEHVSDEDVDYANMNGAESIRMYGARLTSDIGDRPEHYFARREVARTSQDYKALLDDLVQQVQVIEHAQKHGMHRNPDACATYGTCEYFGICSNNVCPKPDEIPNGFRRREHVHPELAPKTA